MGKPPDYYSRFANLRFADFRRLAKDESLSKYERIGFPDEYRAGKEEAIFADIRAKLPALETRDKVVLDIGPGCSDLPCMLVEQCERNAHTLLQVDSDEVLARLPDRPFVRKFAGCFPEVPRLVERYRSGIDIIVAYSVLHYVFAESSVFEFVDRCLALLSPGGAMLLGDVPNVSKRKRFFASSAGILHHQTFTGTSEVPSVDFNAIEAGQIDDSVIACLILRARTQGADAYWLSQAAELPMANRREDILIRRP